MSRPGEMVHHPEHYNVYGEKDEDGSVPFEPIKIVESWGWREGFCYGNAVKYILRATHKGSEKEDLKKAHWYLSRLLSPPSRGEKVPTEVAAVWKLPRLLERALFYIALRWEAEAAQCVEEHLAGMEGDRFFIKAGTAGDCVLWWGPDRCGYTTDINKAGQYAEKEARAIESHRGSDVAWPVDMVLGSSQRCMMVDAMCDLENR